MADPAIGANTNCLTVTGYFDRKDKPHAEEADLAAKRLVAELDAGAIAKGETSLLAPLAKEKTENIYILVIESCRDSPQQSFGQTAAETYSGLVDLRDHPSR